MIKEFRLGDVPWSYLLRFIENPSMKVSKFLLSTKFKYSVGTDIEDINLCRYMVVESKNHLPFASYLSGLICRYEGKYSIPKFIVYDGETFLPEAYPQEFEKGINGETWGNIYIDKMLKFLRVKQNGSNPSL